MGKVKSRAKPRRKRPITKVPERSAQAASPAPPPLRLEWRTPAELKANPANWRRHPDAQVAALSDLIGEVGWAGACLLNARTGNLIDGHARRNLDPKLMVDGKVPVLVGSWSEKQERLILATLDPVASAAEADRRLLDALLAGIETESDPIAEFLSGLAKQVGHVLPEPGEVTDPAGEWVGMPEYEHADLTGEAAFTIRVFLKNAEDLAAFGRLLGKDLTGHKFVWFGKKPQGEIYEAVDGPALP